MMSVKTLEGSAVIVMNMNLVYVGLNKHGHW